jgi:hypothetical protein
VEDDITEKAKRELYQTMQIFAPVTTARPTEGSEVLGEQLAIIEEEALPSNGTSLYLIDDLLQGNRTAPELEEFREQARNDHKDFALLDSGLLVHRGRLVVPATQYLQTRVIEEIHNRVVTAYPGRNKIKKLIAPRY